MATNISQPAAGDEPGGHDQEVMRMQALVGHWEADSDRRAIFLSCYLMMTRNMLEAISQDEFNDSAWVDALLHRFADYYFNALEAYERDAQQAPPVWQMAHDAAVHAEGLPIQELLLGVNAHINYDLVLSLVDLLQPEWEGLTEEALAKRYNDHCRVNDVIGSTIDAVQDQILDPVMPGMEILDRLLGPLDEKLVSHLLSDWREQVWEHAMRVLRSTGTDERESYLRQIEDEALKLGRLIG
jgi:hypothetical protein